MTRHLLKAVALSIGLTAPSVALAVDPAALVADQITVTASGSVEATGSVEIFQDGTTLKAQNLTYDPQSETLTIKGPITLKSADGTRILASEAELNRGLREGIIKGARILIGDRMQVASSEYYHEQGRYAQFRKTVASSCKICTNSPTPIWHIRSKRIIHDRLEKQLYFDEPSVYVLGVPVFYAPRLRFPDPTLKRATGLLAPELRVSTLLGTQILTPYFFKLGEHKDLTLTPQISSKTKTLNYQYRQAFHSGQLSIKGAVSDDDLVAGTRSYIEAYGEFDLARDYTLKFQVQDSSDRDYISNYSFPPSNRLQSHVTLQRTRRDKHVDAGVYHVHSLRQSEINDDLPHDFINFDYRQRLFPNAIGGEVELSATGIAAQRDSTIDVTGRDFSRISLRADWNRRWQLPLGIVAHTEAQLGSDTFWVNQDSTYSQSALNRDHIVGGVELRWPWQRQSADGSSNIIEPVMQLHWAQSNNAKTPNENATRNGFDEGNLFGFSRFSGEDLIEDGFRASLGTTWTHRSTDDRIYALSLGRVIYGDKQTGLNQATSPNGKKSSWVASSHVAFNSDFTFNARALFNDKFQASKIDARLAWTNDKNTVVSNLIWLRKDPDFAGSKNAELELAAARRISRHWTMRADIRYNIVERVATNREVGLEYRNECVKLNSKINQRYSASTKQKLDTQFRISVEFLGLTGHDKSNGSYDRRCSH
ncbi:MAG: LPS-assembly protein LptD [Halocynthiibacter sp.]